ncbi:N-acetyllactosaminide beta-1,3-N-acetylglucosaminyltransferase 3-like [Petromyzon marinus]|uniref:Hexosyltransferase n=1 Tax=Petromyzon marinus TaxID=7757 RepID=A0AAJ7XA39_PETMA|nr:N-acetyllactosaminide beta-1,3-N-acetylglucosaminyltransferase 3-like [Petromyzon marinus]
MTAPRSLHTWLPACLFLLIVASGAIYSQVGVSFTFVKYPPKRDERDDPHRIAAENCEGARDCGDNGGGGGGGDFDRERDLFPPFWEERSAGSAPSWDGHSELCASNASVAAAVEGFSSLPGMIQNFLTHRHCRRFELVLEPRRSKCDPGPVTLLIAIKSDARNLARRDVIRRTWGQERTIKGEIVRRVFLFGVVADVPGERRMRLNALLQEESRLYNDVVQWNFLDTFYNLTLKQLLFLDWMAERCPLTRFIFDGDDDIFVNSDNMVEYVTTSQASGDPPSSSSSSTHETAGRHMYEGYVISNVGPIRHTWSKYYVPVQVQESERYPPYVGGGGIIMSGHTALQIRKAAPSVPLLPIDDVFFGQCLELLGLAPRRNAEFRTAGIHNPRAGAGDDGLSSFHPCYYREVLLVHSLEPFEVQLMWGALKRPWLRCGRPPVPIPRPLDAAVAVEQEK